MSTDKVIDIPEDIKQRIDDKAQEVSADHYKNDMVWGNLRYGSFNEGGEFGYSLAIKELEERDKRIKELANEASELTKRAVSAIEELGRAKAELSSLKSRVLEIAGEAFRAGCTWEEARYENKIISPPNVDVYLNDLKTKL